MRHTKVSHSSLIYDIMKMRKPEIASFLPKHLLFPIPQKEKDANPIIASYIQNVWNLY
jgi:hypothetical protein